MTTKLKCPVCNVPLTACGDLLSCPNDHCAWVGNTELWQALIQAKQDLEIARKALKSAQDHNNRMLTVLGEEVAEESTDDEECCWNENCSLKQELKQALKQIEHKE